MKFRTKSFRSMQHSLMAALAIAAFAPLVAQANAVDDCIKRTQFSYTNGTKTQERAWKYLLDGKKKNKSFDADGAMAKENGKAKTDLNAAKGKISPAINAITVKSQADFGKQADACKAIENGDLATAVNLASSNYSKIRSAFDKL